MLDAEEDVTDVTDVEEEEEEDDDEDEADEDVPVPCSVVPSFFIDG